MGNGYVVVAVHFSVLCGDDMGDERMMMSLRNKLRLRLWFCSEAVKRGNFGEIEFGVWCMEEERNKLYVLYGMAYPRPSNQEKKHSFTLL